MMTGEAEEPVEMRRVVRARGSVFSFADVASESSEIPFHDQPGVYIEAAHLYASGFVVSWEEQARAGNSAILN